MRSHNTILTNEVLMNIVQMILGGGGGGGGLQSGVYVDLSTFSVTVT